ncbi:MAG: DNA replication/repair protein RecF [Simkaniaceae bacterium]
MILKHLILHAFRNYSEISVPFREGINVIQGKNGAGKTSLLEAIFFLSTGRSFRTVHLSDLIKKGSAHFYIEAHFIRDGVEQVLTIGYDGHSRRIHYNNTLFQNFSHVLGILPSVLYAPKDSELISGSPADRRRFLNIQLAQTDPLYVHHLTRYHKAMKHRNALLKQKSEVAIESFEHMMAHSARYLMEKRKDLIEALKPRLKNFATHLSSQKDPFDLYYEPSIAIKRMDEMETLYLKQRPKELILGTTLIGPHRDDFLITYDKKDAKMYASEGQKRTCITALKLSEWEELSLKTECHPLISIDDFGIHLDETRSERLQSLLPQFGQVFLTTPLIEAFPAAYFLHVEEGKLCDPITT